MNKDAPKVETYYDDEERELIETIESGDFEFKSNLTPERVEEVRKIARATINGSRSKVTLRIPGMDLVRIKARALKEGIPYQTLINSILHKELNKQD